jgi:hypothetical protein
MFYIADACNNAVEEWGDATVDYLGFVRPKFPFGGGGRSTGQCLYRGWNPATQQVTTLVGSGLSSPTRVAVDALDNVYIADFQHNAIEQWNSAIQQLRRWCRRV